MRHVREERRLRTIDFGQGIRALTRPLILVCASDGRGHLCGQEFDEALISGIDGTVRIERRDKVADRIAAFRAGDGHDQRLARRVRELIRRNTLLPSCCNRPANMWSRSTRTGAPWAACASGHAAGSPRSTCGMADAT